MGFLIAKVTDYNIPRSKWLELREVVKSYEGKEIIISIERKTKKRSLNQNRYYWGVVIELTHRRMLELGTQIDGKTIDKEDVHGIFSLKFLKRRAINDNGEFVESFARSKELTTEQFGTYISDIQQWCSEVLQLFIPDPDPAWLEEK